MRSKKASQREFEGALIADAGRTDAWEQPIHVEPIFTAAASTNRTSGANRTNEVQASASSEFHIIGEMAVWFANLELFLELSIWQLVANDDDDQRQLMEAITVEMSFDRKVHAFSSLFKLKFPEEAEDPELLAIVKELFITQEERNAILHSGWSYSPDERIFSRMKTSAKAKRGLTRRLYVMTPERLSSVRDHIGEVGQRFARFSTKRIQERLASVRA